MMGLFKLLRKKKSEDPVDENKKGIHDLAQQLMKQQVQNPTSAKIISFPGQTQQNVNAIRGGYNPQGSFAVWGSGLLASTSVSPPIYGGGGQPIYRIGSSNPVGYITPQGQVIAHQGEELKKTAEDVVDEKFEQVKKYVTEAQEIDKTYLQHLIDTLKWTSDYVIGTSAPENDRALDMSLFAKLSSKVIEEAEKVLAKDRPSNDELGSLQIKIEGLFEFLKDYGEDVPRKKEVEDELNIADDLLKRRAEAKKNAGKDTA